MKWLLKMIPTILKAVASIGIGLFKKEKAESDRERANAATKTVESVNESLEVEKEVRESNKEDGGTDVEKDDGSLDFSDFNNDK